MILQDVEQKTIRTSAEEFTTYFPILNSKYSTFQVPGLTHNQLTEFYPKYPDIDDITLTIADQNKIIVSVIP